jgi:hypothetical protein
LYDTIVKAAIIPDVNDFFDGDQAQAEKFVNNIEKI